MGEEFVPAVLRSCVEYLEGEGLEVMGIFRRAPNNVKCRMIKRQFDFGGYRWVWSDQVGGWG